MSNNRPPSLDEIPTFVAVAETLGFRAAAERLGVTPAAVSRAVQRLEQRLGTRLFARSTRRVSLTGEGERFAARCREALAQIRFGEEELADARAAPRGTLIVSASPILARLVVPRLSTFLLRHPGVRAELHLTDRVVRFAEGDVEVALRVGPVADESLVARALLRPRWMTVASPSYLARKGVPRSIADLAAHDCLAFGATRRARSWTFRDRDGELVPFAPKGPLDVDIGDVLVDGALAELGVAQVLDFMAAEHVRAGRLVEILGELSAPGPIVHAVHPGGPRVLPRVRAFIAFLVEELRA